MRSICSRAHISMATVCATVGETRCYIIIYSNGCSFFWCNEFLCVYGTVSNRPHRPLSNDFWGYCNGFVEVITRFLSNATVFLFVIWNSLLPWFVWNSSPGYKLIYIYTHGGDWFMPNILSNIERISKLMKNTRRSGPISLGGSFIYLTITMFRSEKANPQKRGRISSSQRFAFWALNVTQKPLWLKKP